MLFKVHSDMATGVKDFFEENPGAKALKSFNDLSSRQMFFVSLVSDSDYDSPLRSLPDKARREKAVVIAGYPFEGERPDKNGRNLISKKVPSVEKAIAEYRDIQYDEDKAMLQAINMQIQETFEAMGLDKREAARVVKTKTDKATGNTEKTEFVDSKLLSVLRLNAIKLGAELPSLKKAKMALLEELRVKSPIQNVTTFTAQDIINDEEEDEDEERSTLDEVTERRRQNEQPN